MRAKRNRCVSVERIVNASPEAVFAVLSNPRQHSSIDGSRTLLGRDCENSLQTTPLRLDSTFHTAMRRWPASLHMTDLVQAVIATARRGRMRNTVVEFVEFVEFVENRRIAWQNFGRHIWRYELQPLSAGDNSQVDRTVVRESFDYANNLCPPLRPNGSEFGGSWAVGTRRRPGRPRTSTARLDRGDGGAPPPGG